MDTLSFLHAETTPTYRCNDLNNLNLTRKDVLAYTCVHNEPIITARAVSNNCTYTRSQRCLKVSKLLQLHPSHIWSVQVALPLGSQIENFTENRVCTKRSMFGMIRMQLSPIPLRMVTCLEE